MKNEKSLSFKDLFSSGFISNKNKANKIKETVPLNNKNISIENRLLDLERLIKKYEIISDYQKEVTSFSGFKKDKKLLFWFVKILADLRVLFMILMSSICMIVPIMIGLNIIRGSFPDINTLSSHVLYHEFISLLLLMTFGFLWYLKDVFLIYKRENKLEFDIVNESFTNLFNYRLNKITTFLANFKLWEKSDVDSVNIKVGNYLFEINKRDNEIFNNILSAEIVKERNNNPYYNTFKYDQDTSTLKKLSNKLIEETEKKYQEYVYKKEEYDFLKNLLEK